MEKRILTTLISITLAGIMLSGAVMAMNVTQQVTVTIVSGFFDVFSPVQDKYYQTNMILINLNVTSPYDINYMMMNDNGAKHYLCSRCKSFNDKFYFQNGKHNVSFEIEFANGNILKEEVNFFVDSGSDIYLYSGNVLKKATSKEIVDYLFHYDFTLTYKNSPVPKDSCSVRAKNGNASVNNENFGAINSINFYSVASMEQGQLEMTIRSKRSQIGYKFKLANVTESSDKLLKLDLNGATGKAVLEFDKVNKKVKISGNNFSVENMNAYFIRGCEVTNQSFYLLEKGNRISRSIEEVRQILIDNPIFIKRFESLNYLFSVSWRIRQFFGVY